MTPCRECGKEISSIAEACPNCGAKVLRSGMPRWLWIPIALVGGFLLLLVIGANAPPPDEKARARMAIATCWDEQAKKSNAPDTARFIASTCEMMERKFRDQYHANP